MVRVHGALERMPKGRAGGCCPQTSTPHQSANRMQESRPGLRGFPILCRPSMDDVGPLCSTSMHLIVSVLLPCWEALLRASHWTACFLGPRPMVYLGAAEDPDRTVGTANLRLYRSQQVLVLTWLGISQSGTDVLTQLPARTMSFW